MQAQTIIADVLSPTRNTAERQLRQLNHKPTNPGKDTLQIEVEDDGGKIQQVSGGFGDSNSMDPETLKVIMEHQQKADQIIAKL